MKKPEMTLTITIDDTKPDNDCSNTIVKFKSNGVPLSIERQIHFHIAAILHECTVIPLIVDHISEKETRDAHTLIKKACETMVETISLCC